MIKKLIFAVMTLCILGITGCGENEDKEYIYDIEKIYDEKLLSVILEGKLMPQEVIYFMGGESCRQFSSTDPKTIKNYIKALRDVGIEKETADPDEFVGMCDANEEVTFVLEGDQRIIISIMGDQYITVSGVQYTLSNVDKLREQNRRMCGD